MIMIYNCTNKATTSLKRARRQNRELDSIVKFYGEMGKDPCPSLIQLRIENIDSRNRKDGRRKLISVFNNPHRKGLSSPPVIGDRPVKILNVN